MQTIDQDLDNQEGQDAPIETLHLYVVREPLQQPSRLLWLALALSLFALSVLVTLSLLPYRQPIARVVIRVPAVFSPLKVYTASAPILVTGIKTYSATQAHGAITIYNGSILSQEIPEGMILTTRSGIEVVTDTNVFVPAGNPPNFGIATVQAHVAVAGVQGNIPAWEINQSFGTSLYLRNLSAFRGGRNSYSVQVITPHDIQTATSTARATLAGRVNLSVRTDNLAAPCTESVKQTGAKIFLSWACLFYTFHVPAYLHITSFQLVGKSVLVEAYSVARPVIIQFK